MNDELPQHEFSKYIEQPFINKQVNRQINVTPQSNFYCKDDIMLEPRLQEYIKKKEYYRENNITPCISLEKEFQISRSDITKIKTFVSGNKNINHNNIPRELNNGKKNKFPQYESLKSIYPTPPKNYFSNTPSPNDAIYSSSNFNNTYSSNILDSRDFLDKKSFNKDLQMQSEVDFSDLSNKSSECNYKKSEPIKNEQLKNMLNDPDLHEENHKFDDYDNFIKQTYKAKNNNDKNNNTQSLYTELNLPKERLKENPQFKHNARLRDVELETSLITGNMTKGHKSFGYENPVEHYFNYIDDDFQHPNNVVMNIPRGGYSTRLTNKTEARNINREVFR